MTHASQTHAIPATTPARIPGHLWIGLFLLASVAAFWPSLRQWATLSLDDNRYSHLVLIPFIIGFFFYTEQRTIFSAAAPAPRSGAPLLAFAVALYAVFALGVIQASPDYRLTLLISAVVLAWCSGFVLCYGPRTLRAGRFLMLLLLLLVPVPLNWMDGVVTSLQQGSAEVTFAFFRLLDVPVFRDGVRFELPQIGIEIAKECSSIHSGCALFITGILLSHIFLKSWWLKLILVVFTVPIAMFTNAVRIVTLWTLATKVDVRFLTGSLHHQGGIVFSLISLSVLGGLLFLLRKLERRAT